MVAKRWGRERTNSKKMEKLEASRSVVIAGSSEATKKGVCHIFCKHRQSREQVRMRRRGLQKMIPWMLTSGRHCRTAQKNHLMQTSRSW